MEGDHFQQEHAKDIFFDMYIYRGKKEKECTQPVCNIFF
jgi:hypothetical protein